MSEDHWIGEAPPRESDIVIRIEAERVNFNTSTPVFRIHHAGKDYSTFKLEEFKKALEQTVAKRIREAVK